MARNGTGNSSRPRRGTVDRTASTTDPERTCPVCSDDTDTQRITLQCCSNTLLHRQCVQKWLDASGEIAKCPCCRDQDIFTACVVEAGLSFTTNLVPAWSQAGSYGHLVDPTQGIVCVAETCVCPKRKGRSHDDGETPKGSGKCSLWTMIICEGCGYEGAHVGCLDLNVTVLPKPAWFCETCIHVMRKSKEQLARSSDEEEGNGNDDINDSHTNDNEDKKFRSYSLARGYEHCLCGGFIDGFVSADQPEENQSDGSHNGIKEHHYAPPKKTRVPLSAKALVAKSPVSTSTPVASTFHRAPLNLQASKNMAMFETASTVAVSNLPSPSRPVSRPPAAARFGVSLSPQAATTKVAPTTASPQARSQSSSSHSTTTEPLTESATPLTQLLKGESPSSKIVTKRASPNSPASKQLVGTPSGSLPASILEVEMEAAKAQNLLRRIRNENSGHTSSASHSRSTNSVLNHLSPVTVKHAPILQVSTTLSRPASVAVHSQASTISSIANGKLSAPIPWLSKMQPPIPASSVNKRLLSTAFPAKDSPVKIELAETIANVKHVNVPLNGHMPVKEELTPICLSAVAKKQKMASVVILPVVPRSQLESDSSDEEGQVVMCDSDDDDEHTSVKSED